MCGLLKQWDMERRLRELGQRYQDGRLAGCWSPDGWTGFLHCQLFRCAKNRSSTLPPTYRISGWYSMWICFIFIRINSLFQFIYWQEYALALSHKIPILLLFGMVTFTCHRVYNCTVQRQIFLFSRFKTLEWHRTTSWTLEFENRIGLFKIIMIKQRKLYNSNYSRIWAGRILLEYKTSCEWKISPNNDYFMVE